MTSQAMRTTKPPRKQDAITGSCTIVLSAEEIYVPASVFTLAGFRAWAKSDESPEKARLTFIDGEVIIQMAGEELQTHALVKTAVVIVVGPLCAGADGGFFCIDSFLITNEAANVSNMPDAVFISYASIEAGRARMIPREDDPQVILEIEGSPDWVMEIVSRSSVRKDTVRLREFYHRAGIREYWLIDARGEEIVFQILIHGPDGYEPAPQRGGWQRSPVFGRRFRLVRERDRLGFWKYTLQVKPAR
jgi:Uma2 family endonuclease